MTVTSPATPRADAGAPLRARAARPDRRGVVDRARCAARRRRAAAGAATPTPSPTAAAPTGTTAFTLSPVGNGIVRPGDGLTRLGDAAERHRSPRRHRRHGRPSRSATRPSPTAPRSTAWLAGETAGARTADGRRRPICPPCRRRRRRPAGIGSPPRTRRWPVARRACTRCVASYEGPAGTVSSTSAMIVPDDAAAAGRHRRRRADHGRCRSPRGLLTADRADRADRARRLTHQPARTRSTGTARSSRSTRRSPPPSGCWAPPRPRAPSRGSTRLEALPNARFALQFGDADVAVQLQAGCRGPLQPTSLQAYMSAGELPARDRHARRPTLADADADADPDRPGAPVYPDLAELARHRRRRAPGVYWPATGHRRRPTSSTTLGALDADDQCLTDPDPLGLDRAGARPAPPSPPTRTPRRRRPARLRRRRLARRCSEASLDDENALRGAPLTAATAYLAFAVARDRRPPAAGDRSTATSTARASASRTRDHAPPPRPRASFRVGARRARRRRRTEVEIADAAADAARVAAASALFADEHALARVRDGPRRPGAADRTRAGRRSCSCWATAGSPSRRRGRPAAWPTRSRPRRRRPTLDSVGILPPEHDPAVQRRTPICRFWVRNDLPYPVNVVLYATPDDLRLEVQPRRSTSQVAPRATPASRCPCRRASATVR